MGLDDAQPGFALREVSVQSGQHVGAGDIDDRRIGQVADDQPKRRGRLKLVPHDLSNVFDIEVEQRGLRSEDHDARHRLVVRVALQVGIAPRAGDSAEESDVRACSDGEQHQQRRDGGEQHLLEDPQQQHGDQRHDRDLDRE
jgi:hypothetical protein